MPNQDQPIIPVTPLTTPGGPVSQPVVDSPAFISTESMDVPPPPIVIQTDSESGSTPPPIVSSEAGTSPVSILPETPATGTDQTPPPLNVSPVVVTGGSGGKLGKKMNGKGIIAAVLGLLFLVGGVGTGLYLSGQPQDIREEAAVPEVCSTDSTGGCSGKSWSSSCGTNSTCELLDPPASGTDGNQKCYCKAPAGNTFKCQIIKTYKVTGDITNSANWNLLTTNDLKTLKKDDVVYFAIVGNSTDTVTTNGGFDKAEFTINGGGAIESTNVKPRATTDTTGVVEFYYKYTIPTGMLTFEIEGRLHHITAGWM